MSTKRRLLTNFLSLASVQGLNFILPLVTLPYLGHVLGASKFGLISFAQAFIQYFILFTDYGFNLVATREISIVRDNKQRLSAIFSSVMLIRSLLLFISFIILLICILTVPKFQGDGVIYLITFGMVLGNVLFPVWFFQGIEQMKTISILNVISKLIFTLGIFVFVKDSSQYLLVPIINTLGSVIIGIIALYIILYKYKISFSKPSKLDITHQFKEGWHIFVSNIVTSLYTTSNIFILGFFVSNTIVGYYSFAEKVIKAVSSVISPLVQTVYPYLSKAFEESKEKALWILNRMFVIVTIGMGVLSLAIFLFAEPLFLYFLGEEYIHSIPLLIILSPTPLVLGWANIFGILTMINFDFKKQLSQIYICASIFSVVLMVILIPQFKEFGTAWNALLTESLATLLMAIFLWRKGIKVWSLSKKRKEYQNG